jgi:transketolase
LAVEYKQTRQGYADALINLARRDTRVIVLDCDVSKATKTCDFAAVFPNRFFNCGTQEQNMISVAAGLALEGMIPFATTFAMFAACRGADQVRNSVAYPKLNVKIGATHGGISTGGDGASHQCNEDIAIMRSLPNMTVLVPGDYEEARLATEAAAEYPGPVYLRFGRDKYPVVDELHGDFRIGRSKTLRDGEDLAIITTGIMASEGLRAANELARTGLSVRVVHMSTIKPLDEEAVLKAARETRGIITAEEHSVIGGLGEAVAGCVSASSPTIVRRVGIRDVYGESGTAEELLTRYGLRASDIAAEAMKIAIGGAVPA